MSRKRPAVRAELEHVPVLDDPFEQLARRQPRAFVRATQRGSASRRRRDGRPGASRASGAVTSQVTSVLDAVREEVVVAAAEQRRAQRAHRARARRWDRRRRGAPRAGRAPRGCRRRASSSRRGTGCPRPSSACLEEAERRARREQDADVAEPRRPPRRRRRGRPTARSTAARIVATTSAASRSRMRVGVGIVRRARSAPSSVTAGPLGGARARRLERVVLGLRTGERLDELAEHVVDPRQHRRGRAEVAT